MSTVDNRVIRMTFDNAQFEKNIKTTMNTLSDFEKSLKLDGAAAGFEELKKSTDKLDISAIGNKAAKEAGRVSESASDAAKSLDSIDKAVNDVDMSGLGRAANSAAMDVNEAASSINMSQVSNEANSAAEGFSAFETIAVGALLKVGESVTDLVQNKLMSLGSTIKQYTIDPISDGFKEYEQQMGSIQTILANTGLDFDSDEDIQRVNDALDKLNLYADETIYKFGDMTQAIGTFTAAGLELDDAVDAVKGVANVAAFSGASASDVHRVLPQIAQALSAGTVTLQDWRSVETANMASRGFVKTIGNVAKHMAEVQKASNEAAEAGQALIDKQVTMRQALNKKDYKEWADWFTSDILSETLKAFTYDLTSATDDEERIIREHLAEIGFLNKEEQDELIHQAEMATRAATEVRTWTQLWDTVGESIGSNWAGIWRNLLGDFKQATDTFTFLSNTISDAIDGMLGGFVNAAKVFNQSGAIDLIFGGFKRYTQEDFENGLIDEDMIGSKVVDELTNELVRIPGVLDNIVAAISAPLTAIGDAFNAIFGPGPGATQEEIDAFNEALSIDLISIAMALNDFTQSLILSDDAVAGLRNIFEGLFAVADVGIQIILDLGAAFFGFIDIVRTITDPLIDIALTLGGQVGKVLVWFHDKFLEVRAAVIEAIQPFFNIIDVIKETIAAFFGLVDIPGKIDLIGDGLIDLLEILWQIIDIPGKIQFIGDILSNIFGFIGEITGWNSAVEETNRIFEETGERVNVVSYMFGKLLETPIGQFFKGIADAVMGAVDQIKAFFLGNTGAEAEGAVEQAGGFIVIFETIQNVIAKAGEALSPFFSALGSGLLGSIMLFVRLIESIGSFIIRLGEAFVAWEPVQNVINMLTNFKDGVVNFFLSLPERIAGMNSDLSGELGGFQDMFGGVITWFNDTIEYFSNVSVDQFIADVQAWANGIVDSIKGIFNYFVTVDPATLIDDIYNGIIGALNSVGDGISIAIAAVFGLDSEFGKNIKNGWNDYVYSPIVSAISSIHSTLSEVASESDSIPDFIVKLFGRIGKAVRDGIDGIIESIASFTPKVFFDNWMNVSNSLYSLFIGLFPDLEPILSDAFNAIDSFFADVTKNADNWGDVLLNIGGKILEGLSFIPELLATAFVVLKNALIDSLGWLTEKLEQIPGPIGDFFGMLNDKINGLSDTLTEESKSTPAKFEQMFGSIGGPVDDALANLQRFWDGFKIENIPSYATDFLDNFKNFIKEKFDGIVEYVKTIPERFSELWENFGDLFSEENIEKVVDIVNKVLAGKLMWSLASFIRGLGNLTNGIGKYLKHKNWQSVSDQIKNVAIAIGILAAALWVISTIENPQQAIVVLAEVAGVLIAMELIAGILQRFNLAGGEDLIKAAGSLALLAGGILLLMYTVEKLSAFDYDKNRTGLLALGGILVIFAGWTHLLGDGGKNAIQASIAIGILSLSLMLLLPAIERLTAFVTGLEEKDLWVALGALAALGAFVLAMGKALDMVGKHGIGAGIGFLLLAASIHIIAQAVMELAKLDLDTMVWGFVGLATLMLEFATIAYQCKSSDLIATGLALVIFSGSVLILAAALDMLSKNNWESIAAASLGITAMIGVLGLMTYKLNAGDLVTTSAAIIVFSAGVGVLAYALYQLAQVDAVGLAVAAGAISIMLLALGGLVQITREGDLLLTSAAIIVFSAGVGILAYALYQLAQVNADALWTATAVLGVLIGIFGALAIVLSLPGIAEGAAIVLPMLALAFIAVGGAAYLIATALDIAVGAITKLALAGPILTTFVMLISEHILDFVGAAIALAALGLALIPLGAGLLLFGAGAVVAGTGLILLSTGIREFLVLIADLPMLLDNAAASIGEFILSIPERLSELFTNIGTWFTEVFLPGLGEMLAGFWEWVTTEAIPKLGEFFGEVFNKLGEFLSGFFAWLQSDGLPALGQAASDFWNWVTTEGLPKLGEFIGEIFSKLGELLSMFFSWLQSDGLPALGQAASDFWNWVTTEGLPMLGNFIVEIFGKLGELLSQFGQWVITDGIPAVGRALVDIIGKAGELFGMLADWAKGIPGAIWNGIQGIWSSITSIGSDIVRGIVDGITNAPSSIANALSNAASNGLNAAKRFLGISSPSRVMRDQVGRFIPEGLAVGINEYAKVAVAASENLAKNISNGVNKNIDVDDPDFGFNYGKITPVLDMSNVEAEVSNYTKQWDGLDFNAISSNIQKIDANLDLTPMLNTAMDQTNRIAELTSQNQKLLNEIAGLRNDMAAYNDVISRMSIVMDSGTLVGELSAPMDSALGMRQNMVGRGVL